MVAIFEDSFLSGTGGGWNFLRSASFRDKFVNFPASMCSFQVEDRSDVEVEGLLVSRCELVVAVVDVGGDLGALLC